MAEVTKAQLETAVATMLASAQTPKISATDLRGIFTDTLDSLAFRAEIGGGTASVVAYSAPLTNIAATTYATATQILDVGTETINLGAFTVDATGTRDRLVIPEDGLYDLRASVHVTSAQRIIAVVQFTLTTALTRKQQSRGRAPATPVASMTSSSSLRSIRIMSS